MTILVKKGYNVWGVSCTKKYPNLTSTLVIVDHFSQKKGKHVPFNGILVTKLKVNEDQCLNSNLLHMWGVSCPKNTQTYQYFGNFFYHFIFSKKCKNGTLNGILVIKLKIIEGQSLSSNLPFMWGMSCPKKYPNLPVLW